MNAVHALTLRAARAIMPNVHGASSSCLKLIVILLEGVLLAGSRASCRRPGRREYEGTFIDALKYAVSARRTLRANRRNGWSMKITLFGDFSRHLRPALALSLSSAIGGETRLRPEQRLPPTRPKCAAIPFDPRGMIKLICRSYGK